MMHSSHMKRYSRIPDIFESYLFDALDRTYGSQFIKSKSFNRSYEIPFSDFDAIRHLTHTQGGFDVVAPLIEKLYDYDPNRVKLNNSLPMLTPNGYPRMSTSDYGDLTLRAGGSYNIKHGLPINDRSVVGNVMRPYSPTNLQGRIDSRGTPRALINTIWDIVGSPIQYLSAPKDWERPFFSPDDYYQNLQDKGYDPKNPPIDSEYVRNYVRYLGASPSTFGPVSLMNGKVINEGYLPVHGKGASDLTRVDSMGKEDSSAYPGNYYVEKNIQRYFLNDPRVIQMMRRDATVMQDIAIKQMNDALRSSDPERRRYAEMIGRGLSSNPSIETASNGRVYLENVIPYQNDTSWPHIPHNPNGNRSASYELYLAHPGRQILPGWGGQNAPGAEEIDHLVHHRIGEMRRKRNFDKYEALGPRYKALSLRNYLADPYDPIVISSDVNRDPYKGHPEGDILTSIYDDFNSGYVGGDIFKLFEFFNDEAKRHGLRDMAGTAEVMNYMGMFGDPKTYTDTYMDKTTRTPLQWNFHHPNIGVNTNKDPVGPGTPQMELYGENGLRLNGAQYSVAEITNAVNNHKLTNGGREKSSMYKIAPHLAKWVDDTNKVGLNILDDVEETY